MRCISDDNAYDCSIDTKLELITDKIDYFNGRVILNDNEKICIFKGFKLGNKKIIPIYEKATLDDINFYFKELIDALSSIDGEEADDEYDYSYVYPEEDD